MNKSVWRPINLLSRNKITANVNGDHLSSFIKHLCVWKGAGACILGQLWPNQQHWYGRSGIHWGTKQFWRETPCMEVVALMSGAQAKEAHQAYKEGDGSHGNHYWVLFCLWPVWLVCLFSCLVETAVLFSTRVFLSGNPTFILGGLRVPTKEIGLYISTFQHQAKLHISSAMQFLLRIVLCRRV